MLSLNDDGLSNTFADKTACQLCACAHVKEEKVAGPFLIRHSTQTSYKNELEKCAGTQYAPT